VRHLGPDRCRAAVTELIPHLAVLTRNTTMNTKTITVGPRSMEEMAAFERDIDAIKEEVWRKVGDEDARYIKGILTTMRVLEASGRALMMFGWFPPTWLLGAFLLGLAKIIDNMELGHNVMHGQFNFMNDPRFQGDTFEWDNACPREGWRHVHNYVHHTYTTRSSSSTC